MLVSPVNFNPAIFFDTNHSLEMRLFWKHKKCLQSYCGHSPFHYSCPENSLQKKQLFAKKQGFWKEYSVPLQNGKQSFSVFAVPKLWFCN